MSKTEDEHKLETLRSLLGMLAEPGAHTDQQIDAAFKYTFDVFPEQDRPDKFKTEEL